MKRKLISLALVCAIFALAFPAGAQSLTRLERATISLWPEYDQPRVLVIIQAELPADANFPTQLEMLIPGDVGQPFAVAQRASDNRLVNADFDFREGPGEWSSVTVTAETSTIWVEYYDDLIIEDTIRSFEYVWPGTPLTAELSYEVQHPVGAFDLELDPPALEQTVGADGLVYSRGVLQERVGSDLPSVFLEYQKESAVLTIDTLDTAPSPGTTDPAPAAAGQGPADWLPYVVGGVGLALLVGAGLLYLRNREAEPGEPPHRRGPRRASGAAGTVHYCHSCGTEVGQGDRFCSNCGAALR